MKCQVAQAHEDKKEADENEKAGKPLSNRKRVATGGTNCAYLLRALARRAPQCTWRPLTRSHRLKGRVSKMEQVTAWHYRDH
jgi:hypothetical protein